MSTQRRGRRPAGSGTREAILEAARSQFGELGYRRTTLRSVAATADVDPRLVLHYFGSKRRLFIESVRLPVDPDWLAERVFAPGEQDVGWLAADALVSVLEEPDSRQAVIGLLRAAASEREAAQLIREVLTERVLLPITARLSGDQPRLRASLCASQLVGIAMARYVIGIEPLASMSPELLTGALAPVLGHFLTGDLTAGTSGDEGQPASGSPS